jgi:hypothetical protein
VLNHVLQILSGHFLSKGAPVWRWSQGSWFRWLWSILFSSAACSCWCPFGIGMHQEPENRNAAHIRRHCRGDYCESFRHIEPFGSKPPCVPNVGWWPFRALLIAATLRPAFYARNRARRDWLLASSITLSTPSIIPFRARYRKHLPTHNRFVDPRDARFSRSGGKARTRSSVAQTSESVGPVPELILCTCHTGSSVM